MYNTAVLLCDLMEKCLQNQKQNRTGVCSIQSNDFNTYSTDSSVWFTLACFLPPQVVGGIAMTKLLAVFALVFASPLIFDVYYFRMYMSLLLWATLHGLVLLPVLLSYIGEWGGGGDNQTTISYSL